MSSPVVAGIAGLILAKNPNMAYDELKQRLIGSANPEDLYRDGLNNAYRPQVDGLELVPLLGAGVVDAVRAVDPSQATDNQILTQKRDAVKPGCGSIGLQRSASWWMGLLIAPLLLGLVRKRDKGES